MIEITLGVTEAVTIRDLMDRIGRSEIEQIFPNRGIEFYDGVEKLCEDFSDVLSDKLIMKL